MTLALALFLVVLLVLDWRQTLWIFAHGRGELNPVIRWAHARWGTDGIGGYFAACIAAVLLAQAMVPWAWMVLAPIALIQAAVVIRNWRRGVRP